MTSKPSGDGCVADSADNQVDDTVRLDQPVPPLSSEPPPPSGWRNHAGPVLLIILFTAVLFLPLFNGQTYSIVGAHMSAQYPWAGVTHPDPRVIGTRHTQSDHAETFYPLSVFATNALRNGELPMWLPYNFAGIPIMELGLSGLLYPPRLALMLVLPPIRQHDLLLISHVLAAGLGMYALLRLWGVSASGAALGAIAWEASGHNAFWLTVEHVAIVAAWFPIILAASTLSVRRLSFGWSAATGAAFSMAVLGGYAHYAGLTGIALAGWYGSLTLGRAIRHYREREFGLAVRSLSLPAVSIVVAAAFTACYWLPLLGWLGDVHRHPLSLETQLSTVLRPEVVLSALIRPSQLFGLALRGADFSGFAFTGLPAAILALISIFKRSSAVVFGWILTLCSLSVALGGGLVLSLLRLLFPLFKTIYPHAFFFLFCFGVSVLGAFGLTVLETLLSRVRAGSLLAALAVVLVIGVDARQLISVFRQVNPRHPASQEWLFPPTDLIRSLQQSQLDRRLIPLTGRLPNGNWCPPVLVGKTSATFSLRSAFGYESLLPSYVARTWRAVELGGVRPENIPDAYRPSIDYESVPLHLLENLSVGLLVGPPNLTPREIGGSDPVADGTLILIYDGPDGRVYEDPRALPRAHLVQNLVAVDDPETALDVLLQPSFDATKTAIVLSRDEPLLRNVVQGTTGPGSATMVGDWLNRVDVQVESPGDALLVLNDSWAPGWRAYVDGRETPVVRTNYAFRGVPVQGGAHTVVFVYRPTLLIAGIAISIISGTITLLVSLALWYKNRSRTVRSL
ncbi:MAG TPA: YfhO family protein [Blastocatellia bacterium]|nr:YfhO family protein [Blastocatellia bacterium]